MIKGFETEIYIVFFVVLLFFVILLIFGIVSFLNDFSIELRRLNSEIRRTRGEERKYWKRRRIRLWLSLLPFVKY